MRFRKCALSWSCVKGVGWLKRLVRQEAGSEASSIEMAEQDRKAEQDGRLNRIERLNRIRRLNHSFVAPEKG